LRITLKGRRFGAGKRTQRRTLEHINHRFKILYGMLQK